MKFLFRPVDIAALAFFRFIFGILVFCDLTGLLTYKHWYKGFLDPDAFHFKYYGFEWVKIFGDPWMSLFILSLMVASLCITLGYRYRLCSIYLALGYTYTYLMEKAFYLNHGYLTCVLCFILIFLPAHRNFSIDMFRGPKRYLDRIPYWPIFLLQFMMGVVYLFGGIAKLNPDWLRAMPLSLWLKAKKDMPLLGWIWEQEWTAYFMSYGGLGLDLFVVFFLLFRKTRKWAFIFVLFFHTVNLIIFKIGIFPWLSLTLTALYFSADFPRAIFNWFNQKLPFLRMSLWEARWGARKAAAQLQPTPPRFSNRKIITITIALFCTLHCLIPLRHHYFPGDVAWTEEGHRYSWRMMLRSKRGYGHFMVKDGKTGKTEKVNSYDFLNEKQGYKLFTHPDMILQFAHYLRDKYTAEGFEDLEVYAHIKTRLNDHKRQAYIDETRDLAKVEWEIFKSSDWILTMSD